MTVNNNNNSNNNSSSSSSSRKRRKVRMKLNRPVYGAHIICYDTPTQKVTYHEDYVEDTKINDHGHWVSRMEYQKKRSFLEKRLDRIIRNIENKLLVKANTNNNNKTRLPTSLNFHLKKS